MLHQQHKIYAVDINILQVQVTIILFYLPKTFDSYQTGTKKYIYHKHPCISCTFFHKIEAKNQGSSLSMDTSVFGVLKNLINIHKTS